MGGGLKQRKRCNDVFEQPLMRAVGMRGRRWPLRYIFRGVGEVHYKGRGGGFFVIKGGGGDSKGKKGRGTIGYGRGTTVLNGMGN